MSNSSKLTAAQIKALEILAIKGAANMVAGRSGTRVRPRGYLSTYVNVIAAQKLIELGLAAQLSASGLVLTDAGRAALKAVQS